MCFFYYYYYLKPSQLGKSTGIFDKEGKEEKYTDCCGSVAQ